MGAIDLRQSVLDYVKNADNRFLRLVQALAESYEEEDLQRDTIEQYNKEIDEANARIDAGEFYTQEEVEKIARQW
ncbi:hypothetical protein J8281_13935 [Aquimarina sp. U1-2]|uniref:hypothetical protein n=1 Tax=Aquimarina sp. U1-2 TaxID=2823141 RepID=UPI001AECC454|nr:hypothetical protein [Aquimarina sp. U1-2]MBP2833290.1 hypothetical protein [Aquimarina sp. U1-2]